MENPYAAPQGQIYTPTGSQAPLTWKQVLFSFEGRIPRRTYWGFSLLVNLIGFVVGFIFGLAFGEETGTMLALFINIPLLWTSLAITSKRWHDRDKSGWWILIVIIPIIGWIWAFVSLGFLRGTEGPNQYGEDPT